MREHGTHRALRAPLLVATLAVAAAHASPAAAFERRNVVCELDDLTRHVSLRIDPEAGYVCDVLYEKPDEGDTREVLWSARHDQSYCEPRFTDLVEDLAARGWACDWADGPAGADDRPAIGAAQARAAETDGTGAAGPATRLREWCIADATSGQGAEGSGSLDSHCDCVADGMLVYSLSDDDARALVDELTARSAADGEGEPSDPSSRDKRLNTLAVSYEEAVEACL